nr:MAG TPA: hypothetical protein [Caudoviricetes sp.]
MNCSFHTSLRLRKYIIRPYSLLVNTKSLAILPLCKTPCIFAILVIIYIC